MRRFREGVLEGLHDGGGSRALGKHCGAIRKVADEFADFLA